MSIDINKIIKSRAIKSSKSDLGYSFKKELLDYQKAGVEYLLTPGHKLLADDPGLGKTAQFIAVQDVLSVKTLVLCPSSVLFNWKKEFKKFQMKERKVEVLTRKNLKEIDYDNTDIIICSYSSFWRPGYFERLLNFDFKLVGLDEAHFQKNPEAKRCYLFHSRSKGLLKKFKNDNEFKVIGITGTPIQNRPIEIFTLTKSLAWNSIDCLNYQQFGYRYCNGFFDQKLGCYNFKGASNLKELSQKLRSGFMIKRTKSQVLKELPPKIINVVPLDRKKAIPKNEKVDIVDFRKNPKEFLDKFPSKKEFSAYRASIAEEKAGICAKYIEQKLESGVKKIVVFFHHKAMFSHLQYTLKRYSPVEIVGATSVEQREINVSRFQNDPNCRVFLASIKASSTGVTLTAASHIVMAEFDFSPKENEQCNDRVHRIGQKDNVIVDYLVLEGSLEEIMVEVNLNRDRIINQVVA